MIALTYDPDQGVFDVTWSDGHLETGKDLETAAAISLHAHALNPDRNPGEEQGGSPLDEFWTEDAWGSRLWVLARRKATDQEGVKTLRDAEAFADGALQWMVEDGIARQVVPFAEWYVPSPSVHVLRLSADVYRPNTKDPVKLGPWEFNDAV